MLKTLFLICCWLYGVSAMLHVVAADAQPSVTNRSGVRLAVDEQNDLPALRITVPGRPESDPGILVLFPEHVTVRASGEADARQLYLFRPGRGSGRPAWRLKDRSFEYDRDVAAGIHMLARATLEEDGVRYAYEFDNRSPVDYAMVQAVTDPRMVSPYFNDVRLERTYVHHGNGFDLLASETPERMTLPLDRWLPNRYRVPYTWPVDRERTASQPDGITWYNKGRAVDEPFIATTSTDGGWIMATFSYDPGNVWVNPELTCQHADPMIALPAGRTATFELKTLLVRGTLDEVLTRVRQQRSALKH